MRLWRYEYKLVYSSFYVSRKDKEGKGESNIFLRGNYLNGGREVRVRVVEIWICGRGGI